MRVFRIRCGDDRGVAAVEFALIAVPLLILIAGMVTLGAMMYSQITITQAAREAARQLALNIVNPSTGCGDAVCNAKSVANSQAEPLTINWGAGNIAITPCAPGADQSTSATVTISANSLLPILFSDTVTGTASMPCGG